jgi:hypothetical protein
MFWSKRKIAAASATRQLTDYERIMDESRMHLLAERAAENNNPRQRHHNRSHARVASGKGTIFAMMVLVAAAAAIGTQWYLVGMPAPIDVEREVRQFTAGAQDFLRYIMN